MIVLGIILLLIAVMSPEPAALWGVGISALFVGMVLAVGARSAEASAAGAKQMREHSMISPSRTRRHMAPSRRVGEERTRLSAPRTVTS